MTKILISLLVSAESEREYNAALTAAKITSAKCICPSGLRYRLLDALSLALLSRHFPNSEKAFLARKLNQFFESLSAEERYLPEKVTKRVDDLLPTFPGNANLSKLCLNSARANSIQALVKGFKLDFPYKCSRQFDPQKVQ